MGGLTDCKVVFGTGLAKENLECFRCEPMCVLQT